MIVAWGGLGTAHCVWCLCGVCGMCVYVCVYMSGCHSLAHDGLSEDQAVLQVCLVGHEQKPLPCAVHADKVPLLACKSSKQAHNITQKCLTAQAQQTDVGRVPWSGLYLPSHIDKAYKHLSKSFIILMDAYPCCLSGQTSEL